MWHDSVKINPGDRVTRNRYKFNGVWDMFGDDCLLHAPLDRGIVKWRSNIEPSKIFVQLDNGKAEYFDESELEVE